MTFAKARVFVLNFGKHKGETIDDIARTDEGLKYLDWLAGLKRLHPATLDALVSYLQEPSIAGELRRVVG